MALRMAKSPSGTTDSRVTPAVAFCYDRASDRDLQGAGNKHDRQGSIMAYHKQRYERLTFSFMDVEQQQEAFARDVAQGLAAPQKTLPAKYFYDTHGSQLYEQISTFRNTYRYGLDRHSWRPMPPAFTLA